jgi:hypothetical protein
MTALHGKNALIYFNGTNLTGFLKEYSASAKVDTAETSTFGATNKTYVSGLADATLSMSGYYDGSAAAIDSILSAAISSTADAGIIVSPSGSLAIGTRIIAGPVVETSYQVSGSIGDTVAVSAEFQADGGFMSGVSLHALVAETITGTGTGVQDQGSTFTTSSDGLIGVLMVTANTQTGNTTFVIASAATEPTYTTHITFPVIPTNITGTYVVVFPPGVAVNKFLRGAWTCAGTGSITFTMAVVRL